MLTFDIRLDGDGAWPDLLEKQRDGLLIHLGNGSTIGITALPDGMASGRASVALRFDLPDGRTLMAETSLRALFNATNAIVTRYGESFMKSPVSERDHKQALATAALVKQLQDAYQQLGKPLVLDFTETDAVWDREQQLRQALASARSAILSGESMSPTLEAQINNALRGK